jgi:hypothetical protein
MADEVEEIAEVESVASDGDDVVAGIRPPDGREEEDWEPRPNT